MDAAPLVGKDAPFYDPELASNGGPYSDKIEIGQVTVRLPIQWSALPLAALFFGFVPWVIPLVILMYIAFSPTPFLGIFALVLCGICVLVSEVILKHLIYDPRPETTAVRNADGTVTNGMPSGHVLQTCTLAMWFLLESFSRFTLTPALISAALCVALMLAVPWARVYNGDHTIMQVAAGAGLGLLFGLVAFAIDENVIPL
mmetsp:Transcript_19549/g.45457  ORF Transcript_19549/g.45457 Transcript_19549/m.45457 type:complete len:201 (+) Transcript_19549:119-721(+)